MKCLDLIVEDHLFCNNTGLILCVERWFEGINFHSSNQFPTREKPSLFSQDFQTSPQNSNPSKSVF